MSDPDRLAEIRTRRSLVGDHPTREGIIIGDGVLIDLDWLIGEVERLRGLLARLEWAGGTYCDEAACPACGRSWQYPHAADCWWAAEMHPGNDEAAAPKDGGS